MSFRSALFTLSAIAAVAVPVSGASAASQVLGLVASNGMPTPLKCADGQCGAQFSTFCLQQSRPAPSRGDGYSVAAGGSLTLIARNAAGQTLRLPANDTLEIHSVIGFTSVEISLPMQVASQRVAFSTGFMSGVSFGNQLTAGANNGASYLLLYSLSNTGATPTDVTVGNCSASGEVQISGVYRWQ